MAGSFILLAFTGLNSLFGRKVLIPAFGHDTFFFLAVGSKWIHTNVSWAFTLGLALIFVMWVIHNLRNRSDIYWLLKGGDIFSKGHPPAKKFNAAQKMILWSVILLGTTISISGLALLFPFEINMLAATFAKLNAFGISDLLGLGELPTNPAPHQEMQYSQLWHVGVSFLLMAIIIAHIYFSTVGMEGAAEAMTTGEVEGQRAREHHSIRVNEVEAAKNAASETATSQANETLYSATVDGTIRARHYSKDPVASNVIVKHGFGVNELIVNDAGGWLAYGATDGGTRIIDLETGQQIADLTLERRPILSMSFDPKNNALAIANGQGFIMVIDTALMQITHDFQASRNGPIWALAFSHDGQNLHAGGIKDILYSWPLATMTEHDAMQGSARSFLEEPEAPINGERQFIRKCSICHAFGESSARKAGPTLFGLFGRRAATITDYSYSDTLDGSGIVWSAETIDAIARVGLVRQ